MSLWQEFITHEGREVTKWTQYFFPYERHFSRWKNTSLTFLEIGVASGGSIQMWQKYFGPNATIIGIDIMPKCKSFESPNVHVRIGDQSDPDFLDSIISEFGVPDVILDDGSHQQNHIIQTFEYFYPKMHKNGVYMVEDLHTSYWPEYGGGLKNPNTFMEYTKTNLDKLNAVHWRQPYQEDVITNETLAISVYDSIVCYEKGNVSWKKPIQMRPGVV